MRVQIPEVDTIYLKYKSSHHFTIYIDVTIYCKK